MRLIDADALKDAHIGCPANISFFNFGEMVELFLQTIDEQPTITASPWHRVEDGLPRGQELVIVAIKDTTGDTPFWYTQCGWITRDGEYWIIDNEICDYVVAWMPLPEPPKEENQ